MRYLLDTCVVSDFIKGEVGTKVRLKQTSPMDIAVSAITVMELQYGLALNPQRAQKVDLENRVMQTANYNTGRVTEFNADKIIERGKTLLAGRPHLA